MKRKVVSLEEVKKVLRGFGEPADGGIMAIVAVENMGFCKDGVTRWYHFDMPDTGEPAVFYKH